MRVLHVPYSYAPDPAGGTEVYVSALAAEQRALGCEVAIAAPAGQTGHYRQEGIEVWRFGTSAALALRELYGAGDPVAASGFAAILQEYRPAIVHLHGMTSAISPLVAEAAERSGARIVLNYHTATMTCLRGTLLRGGTEICDGRMDRRTCTRCSLTGKGVAPSAAGLLAAVPPGAGAWLGRAGFSGGVWTALRASELTDVYFDAFRRICGRASRVIALCEWTKQLLLRNDIPAEKIVLCRQGIDWQPGPGSREERRPGTPLRLAFLGRLDPAKGPDVAIRALQLDPSLAVELDLYGVRQGEGGDRYAAELRGLSAGDRRIRLLPAVAPAEVIAALAGYDAVLVPSQTLETGPLVVLEAWAAGVPVIGSALGGIAELVTGGGRLVERYSAPEAWLDVLRLVCGTPGLLEEWRGSIHPPRHAREAAAEITAVYESLTRAAG